MDPVWSLKMWPVELTWAGADYCIPAMCAADWLAILMTDNFYLDTVFPGLLSVDEQAQIEHQLHVGDADIEEMYDLALETIGAVSGRKWWVAMRLIGVARESWDALGGEMAAKADASRLSLAAWLDFLFLQILRQIEDSKRTMFLMKLELPPEGWGDAPEQLEMSADAFMGMAD